MLLSLSCSTGRNQAAAAFTHGSSSPSSPAALLPPSSPFSCPSFFTLVCRSAGGIRHAPILCRVRLPLLALALRSSIGRDSRRVECRRRSPSANGKWTSCMTNNNNNNNKADDENVSGDGARSVTALKASHSRSSKQKNMNEWFTMGETTDNCDSSRRRVPARDASCLLEGPCIYLFR